MNVITLKEVMSKQYMTQFNQNLRQLDVEFLVMYHLTFLEMSIL